MNKERGFIINFHEGKEMVLDQYEYGWITRMAILHDCNLSDMARAGGIDRTTLHRLMRKHELTRTDLIKLIRPAGPHAS